MLKSEINVICNMPERRELWGEVVNVDCEDNTITIKLTENANLNEKDDGYLKGSNVVVRIADIKICNTINGVVSKLTDLQNLLNEYCSGK